MKKALDKYAIRRYYAHVNKMTQNFEERQKASMKKLSSAMMMMYMCMCRMCMLCRVKFCPLLSESCLTA